MNISSGAVSHSHSPQGAVLADDPAPFEAAVLEPALLFCWLWGSPASGGASGALVDTGKPWSS